MSKNLSKLSHERAWEYLGTVDSIDIDLYHTYLDSVELFKELYNYAKPQGYSVIEYTPENMTTIEAYEYLKEKYEASKEFRLDYVKGRSMKCFIDYPKNTFTISRMYNEDNGKDGWQNIIKRMLYFNVMPSINDIKKANKFVIAPLGITTSGKLAQLYGLKSNEYTRDDLNTIRGCENLCFLFPLDYGNYKIIKDRIRSNYVV